ncbi:hypothetical protein QO207_12065 [Pseudomonas sp. CAN2814]|jgi:hypothetical protein|nr:hypothetical protein [Pseudomonas sp. CAN1]MDN6857321.1 hypothetical protein [Pseudomonas sp. CAN1]
MTEQRQFHGLRLYVDQLLLEGWSITSREPLTLKRGQERLQHLHGMLLSA